MFYIKVKDLNTRDSLIRFLKSNKIIAPFHYVPLHSSEYGQKWTTFVCEDIYTDIN